MDRHVIKVVLFGKAHTIEYSRGNGNSAANCRTCGQMGHEQLISVHDIKCDGVDLIPRGSKY